MATHATLGNEFGFFVRWLDILDDMGDGGAAVSIDANDQILAEAEAMFDSDATAKSLLADIIGRINLQYAEIQRMKANVMAAFNNWAFQRLAPDISSTASDLRGLLGDWAYQMRKDSKYVKSNGVTVGAATAGPRNTSSYQICITADSPWNDNNENMQTEDLSIICRQDAPTDGATQYKEMFDVQGSITGTTEGIYATMIPGVDSDFSNRLQNAATASADDASIPFVNFTVADTPNDWTLTAGVAGTTILEQTTDYVFGTTCLKFYGDGTVAHEITQDANTFYGASATDQAVTPNEKYIIGSWIKTDATAGVWDMRMTGTGYTPVATEYVADDFSSTPPSSWTLAKAYVRMPKSIPTDLGVRIKMTTILPNGKYALMDGSFFARMRYVAEKGVYIAIIPGGTGAIAGTDPDYWTLSLTNSAAGAMQSFMTLRTNPRGAERIRVRPNLQIYLPHDATASSEYSETKCV